MAGILVLIAVVVIAVLIVVDVIRSPEEAAPGSAGQFEFDPQWAPASARSETAARDSAREPVRTIPPASPAPGDLRVGAGQGPSDTFEPPGQATRETGQARRDARPLAVGDAELRGKLNAMFGNLSRRSQTLVERQLRIIEGLEQGEHDQQRLTSLTRLNRIAMRMHRNAQNLLVLAGNAPVNDWDQPVSLTQLVEAALSEVEGFERVSAEIQPGIAVRGPAVHDLLHLLVELVDNATSFSAADMPVQIKGQMLTTGGALIDITDLGIGMAASEMAEANQLLDNSPADIDVLKWMGLPVVARLAARHGIRVRLNPAEFGGLTALVWLPDEILTQFSPFAEPGYGAAGSRGNAGPVAEQRPPQQPPASRPDPAWSAAGAQTIVQTPPPAAVPLGGSAAAAVGAGAGAPARDTGVVVPPVETRQGRRGLPIFEQVESRRSRGSHEAKGSHAAPAPSPAPSSGGPNRSGLPSRERRSGYQRGAGQGWGTSAEEATGGRPDES
jgi:signal transduction histidine kinase